MLPSMKPKIQLHHIYSTERNPCQQPAPLNGEHAFAQTVHGQITDAIGRQPWLKITAVAEGINFQRMVNSYLQRVNERLNEGS